MPRPGWCGRWLLAAVSLHGSLAVAGPGLDVAAEQSHYRATERFANGSTANTEAGRLEGGRAQLWWDTQPWRVGIALAHLEGRVAYQGRTQIGFPIRSSTRIGIDEAEINGPWSLPDEGPVTAHLLAAVGVRRIDRSIGATFRSTPLTERMHWRFAQIGAQSRWTFGSGWFVGASLMVEQGWGADLAVDFHGAADPITLKPAGGRGHRIGFELGRTIGPGMTLQLQLASSRQRYGASAWRNYTRTGVVAGQVRYPGSIQTLDSIGVLFQKSWD